MPSHIHEYDETNGARILTKVSSGKVGDIDQTGSLDYDFAEAIESTGGDTAHNNIHPVRGIFFLRRTARLYRRRNG
jgi:microcystin-dependent protein